MPYKSIKEVGVEAGAGASCQPCPMCRALPWRHPGARIGDIMRSHTSMSNRKPRKDARTGGAENAIVDLGNATEGVIATTQ